MGTPKIVIVVACCMILSVQPRSHRKSRPMPSTGRIVNGFGVDQLQYPFVVSIQSYTAYNNGWTSFCGGSIVNDRTVLTACHCATRDDKIHGNTKYMVDPATRRIVAGTGFWKRNGGTKQVARVKRVVTHPNCQNFHPMKPFVNDVALYFLADRLYYTPEVKPLTFPKYDVPSAERFLAVLRTTKAWAVAVGWGRTVENRRQQSEVLMGAQVQLLGAEECRYRFCQMTYSHCDTDFDGFGQFCVASPTASNCFGDSGGPLVYNGYVIGIVSYGQGCQPTLPTVYQGLRPILETLKIYGIAPIRLTANTLEHTPNDLHQPHVKNKVNNNSTVI